MATKADLVATMRNTARWRGAKAAEFADDRTSWSSSNRARAAIFVAARFIEALPDDDADLLWLRHVDVADNKTRLGEETLDILSRFGLNAGAWANGHPTEAQIRNLLRRMNGAESRVRAAERRDAL